MTYFSSDFIDFFKELAANNNKEWFDANRKRYENSVKNPFAHFVGDLIATLRHEEPELLAEPKDCIFRINRDIRFAKDKTPYKLQTSALIAPRGRKQMDYPGLYLEISPEQIGIYGGLYMPDKQQLAGVRDFIVESLDAFKKAYTHPDFVATYGGIKGEQNKRLDKKYLQAADAESLLYNKQFYYFTKLPIALLTDHNLLETVVATYHAAAPIREFFRTASGY